MRAAEGKLGERIGRWGGIGEFVGIVWVGGSKSSIAPKLWQVAWLSQSWGYALNVCRHSLGQVNPF